MAFVTMHLLNMFLILLVLFFIAMAVYSSKAYKDILAAKSNVKYTWMNLAGILRQRYDLLPELTTVCSPHMGGSHETLKKISSGRSMLGKAQTMVTRDKADGFLNQALKSLWAASGSYPQLKADSNFIEIMTRLSALGKEIAAARKQYNGCVEAYNELIGKFPISMLAPSLKFYQKEPWRVNPAYRK